MRERHATVEAIVFVGVQGAGKSTFYRQRFFDTHIRINLDMLRTRHRESILLDACLRAKQPFVVDNTNATPEQRARYIAAAKAARFTVTAYYFEPDVRGSVKRNEGRPEKQRIPPAGLFGTLKRLKPPTLEEGFDRIYRVTLDESGGFQVAGLA
jgi:predicted kinase